MASNEYERTTQPPGPDPALQRLDRFVGAWEVTGRTLDSEQAGGLRCPRHRGGLP